MSNQTLRDSIVEHALQRAVFDGWTTTMLDHATRDAGHADALTWRRVFPEGVEAVLEHYRQQIDTRQRDTCANEQEKINAMRIRDRIAYLVMQRLEMQTPHKEALKRAFAFSLIPTHSVDAVGRLWHTADTLWQLAGDTSTDFNYYSKRTLLSKVYLTTLMQWFNDHSEGHSDTEAFLRRRIDNVMQIEKAKATVKKWFAQNVSYFK